MNLYWTVLTWVIPGFLLMFGVGETYAIVKGKPTYTKWIRMKLGLQPPEPRRKWLAPLFAFVLAAFTFWFEFHIRFNIWPS